MATRFCGRGDSGNIGLESDSLHPSRFAGSMARGRPRNRRDRMTFAGDRPCDPLARRSSELPVVSTAALAPLARSIDEWMRRLLAACVRIQPTTNPTAGSRASRSIVATQITSSNRDDLCREKREPNKRHNAMGSESHMILERGPAAQGVLQSAATCYVARSVSLPSVLQPQPTL